MSQLGFRISRHLADANPTNWDTHRYYTVQKLQKREDGLFPDDKYSERHYETHNQKRKSYIKNGSSVPKERPRPFQVHDNERYYNHIFSLPNQRSLAKNIYSKEYFQPNSLDRAEI